MTETETEPVVITHSDIQAFLRCRRLFSFGYIENYQTPETEWGALAVGGRVHRSIETLYKGGDPIAEHDRLARLDLASLEGRPHAGWQTDQLYDDIVMGRNCVEAYVEWLEDTGADDGLDLLSQEETIQAPILGGRVLLRGRVDRKYANELGSIVLDDLKTSGSWRSDREQLERSYQHHVYLVIERLLGLEDRDVAGAFYTVITKVKDIRRASSPLVNRYSAPATRRMADVKLRQIEAICREMLAKIGGVREYGLQVEAFPTPQDACRWCPFKLPCEVLDESEPAARDLLDTHFVRGRRHARYGVVVV